MAGSGVAPVLSSAGLAESLPGPPRASTPVGRSPTAANRNSASGPVRVPSAGIPGGLPLHVTSVGRPRTPLRQGGDSSDGKDSWAPRPERPESSGQRQDDKGSSQGGPGGTLTTVISSALDYKRFLDRRKQMIQQQVETAQSATIKLRDQEDPEPREGKFSQGTTATGTAVSSNWTPGATGPVKASHAVAAVAAAAAAGAQTQTSEAARRRSALSDNSAEDSGTPNHSANSASAAQQLLRRVCIQPDLQRAQTPTRYTQSCGGPSGYPNCDSSNDGRSSRISLAAGGPRKVHGQGHTTGEYETGPAEVQKENSIDALRNDDSDGRPASLITGSNLEDYIIGKQIGQGAYATVAFGLHKESSRKVAIKIYDKYKLLDPQRRKSVRCEIRLMERLKHPNIVVFYEAMDTPKQIYIVMEYVGGGSMHHFLKKRPGRRVEDHQAKRLFFQVCQGLRYLHERHIVHRDIKLENLLMDENGTVKIIDFGFSTVVPPGKKLKIFCGTPSYMAPEIVARKEYSGFCADIWAEGVLLYALLCGSFPFRGQNDRDLYRKIVRGTFTIPEHVGDAVRALLVKVLTTDMMRRPTIVEVLSDPWLSVHREEEQSVRKVSSAYQPNCSVSSTATTVAPSSSTGQSAREIAREISGESPARASSALGTRSSACAPPAPDISGVPHSVQPMAGSGAAAAIRLASSSDSAGKDAFGFRSNTGDISATLSAGTWQALPPDSGSERPTRERPDRSSSERPQRTDEQPGHSIEEEAIGKLERLGYPRDEIVRQLKDDSSHLCKLYHRFLKALTAWDSKK